MATLISVHNSEGCVGRCDAKCHNATLPDCDCVCGGMNHGVGYARACEQTSAMARDWIEAYARRKKLEAFECRFVENGVRRYSQRTAPSGQIGLFGAGGDAAPAGAAPDGAIPGVAELDGRPVTPDSFISGFEEVQP